ncbi:glycosyltransferase family 4 protein [Microbacterium sp. CFH 31415]|uniref:glycosyltransferase family 4 protein n=1 Tax=Microbacterium sp. CFH 31415 TaxID=2921732 RepID=UPI001F141F32|nr:glycosyltransferase family 4 protein [Microbacterium sp. CFH 31415]MCH6230741.1 glycosyltransferase family 4 protein [Microbacterium sp. CFH 31415]
MRGVVHALTPGDHFSPRTGSAIPTVVHGLAQAAASDDRYTHRVLLDESTYRPRYSSADAIEYVGAGFPGRWERAVDLGLSKVGLPRVRARRSYQPMVTALEGQPASVVVAHNAPILPAMLARTAHTPVYYAHNELPRGMSRAEADRALQPAAAVIAVSDDLAERIAARVSPSLARRIRVVENGVDTEAFRPRDADAAPARTRVMFVGRVVADKGPDVLLRAGGMLERDDLEIVIVGSQGFDPAAELSGYEQELRALAAQVPGGVDFRPFVDREALPALLQSADIFVAPSRWPEPSGLTVGEAMATGLPVVASDAGGIPSVIGDAGVLVGPGDESALADALRSLLDDEGKRRTIGVAARRRAEDRSWSHSWAQLRAALDQLA